MGLDLHLFKVCEFSKTDFFEVDIPAKVSELLEASTLGTSSSFSFFSSTSSQLSSYELTLIKMVLEELRFLSGVACCEVEGFLLASSSSTAKEVYNFPNLALVVSVRCLVDIKSQRTNTLFALTGQFTCKFGLFLADLHLTAKAKFVQL